MSKLKVRLNKRKMISFTDLSQSIFISNPDKVVEVKRTPKVQRAIKDGGLLEVASKTKASKTKDPE